MSDFIDSSEHDWNALREMILRRGGEAVEDAVAKLVIELDYPAPASQRPTETERALLIKARDLLTPPGVWTQGSTKADDDKIRPIGARNAMNMPVDPRSPEAVSWTLMGALNHVTEGTGVPQEALVVKITAARDLFPWSELGLHVWNDHPDQTHERVLALLEASLGGGT